MHIFIIKLRRNFFAILFLMFSVCLLLFSKNNLPAIKNGLTLWATSVVPSLFPFFVATELLMHTNIVNFFKRIFSSFMRPIFNVNGEGAFGFIMGLISGYPVGAKIACEFRKNNICSKEECERLLSFTNNSGPLFIVGTVGISMFGSTTIGLLLLVTHVLASLTVGYIFRFWKKSSDVNTSSQIRPKKQKQIENLVCFNNLGEVMSEAINNSVKTVIMIGGFVVVFSSIISILKASGLVDNVYILGLLEITNGISAISSLHVKNISFGIVFSAFLLGFGGISILLQVWSIISKSDLSIKPYIYGKLLHGIISAFYTFIAIWFFPFLNFNL